MAHTPKKDAKPYQCTQALTESSGQGTDGACCEAMREKAAKVVIGWRECDWPEGFDRRTAELMAEDRAARIRTLPLPVSAEVMPAWPDLSFEERRDITTLLQQTAGARTRYENVRGYLRTTVKSKQPSDMGGEK